MESFGHIRGGGRLHQEHLFGEVLANVMADFKILSSGIFYEPYTFRNPNETARELFGPYAYKKNGGFYVIDTAGLDRHYTLEPWYKDVKYRWNTNIESLKTFNIRSMVRSDLNGSSNIRHEHFPLTYKAPIVEQGIWMPPEFKCDDRVDAWVMTYIVPFFRKIKVSRKIKFTYVNKKFLNPQLSSFSYIHVSALADQISREGRVFNRLEPQQFYFFFFEILILIF